MATTFGTDGMQGALNEISNDAANKNHEAAATAREKGWAEPSSYDYEEYGKPAGDATVVDPTMPTWGHNAQKYEWKEEYGEVGPRNLELEQMLYQSEFITRQGIKFDELVHVFRDRSAIFRLTSMRLRSIKVTAETTQADRPAPISDV